VNQIRAREIVETLQDGDYQEIEGIIPEIIQFLKDYAVKGDPLYEVCGRCGLTKGAHHAGRYNMDPPTPPYDYCPGHQGRMDWKAGPGTTFYPTDTYADVPYSTPAKR